MQKLTLATLGIVLCGVFCNASAVSVLAIEPSSLTHSQCSWGIGYDIENISVAQSIAINNYTKYQGNKSPLLIKAPPGDGYGAVAIGRTAEGACQYGYTFNQATENAAQQLALTSCQTSAKKMELPCSIATVWYY
jgi:hypothetical protein